MVASIVNHVDLRVAARFLPIAVQGIDAERLLGRIRITRVSSGWAGNHNFQNHGITCRGSSAVQLESGQDRVKHADGAAHTRHISHALQVLYNLRVHDRVQTTLRRLALDARSTELSL